MAADAHPKIIYVPGLLPKPEAEAHRAALLRCLLAATQRVDAAVAESIATMSGSFDIVAWTYDFYGEYRDIGLDMAAIDDVIAQPGPAARDIADATSWRRKFLRTVYTLGDMLPFLIPHVASERMELHLRDLHRYLGDANGIGTHARRMLKIPLRAAAEISQPVLLIGHSMGSVIAYDALWELTHEDKQDARVDRFLTMGSPLGQRYMQRRIKGADATGAERYPHNIRSWANIAAVGDMTALDPDLGDDFAGAVQLGLIEAIEDATIYNYFRLDGQLNVHAEYGYLANDQAARTVAQWWRSQVRDLPAI
jgi:hypothetical protein